MRLLEGRNSPAVCYGIKRLHILRFMAFDVGQYGVEVIVSTLMLVRLLLQISNSRSNNDLITLDMFHHASAAEYLMFLPRRYK
jgi:hypothetical protein